jgi:hypothetical protein
MTLGNLTGAAMSVRVALSLAALVATAACDSAITVKSQPAADSVAVAASEGRTASASAAAGPVSVRISTDLPRFAPAYPGAAVVTQIASASSGEGGKGVMVVLRTADPVDKVAAFYDARARQAGVAASMIANDGDSAVRIYGDGESRQGAMVAISRGDEGTEIAITSGRGAGSEPPAPKMAVSPGVRLQ